MKNPLKNDNNALGAIIGLLLPIAAFGLLYTINHFIITSCNLDMFMRDSTMKLLSIVFNVIPIRYYFLKLKFEQTGRGVLLVTFVYVVVYFWLIYP